jgi:hypothetical protein
MKLTQEDGREIVRELRALANQGHQAMTGSD